LSIPSYVEKLTSALQKRLRGSHVIYEHVRRDRFRFEVVWKKFDRMDHPERQKLVWDIVEEELPKDDLLKVSMIITMGPSDLPKD